MPVPQGGKIINRSTLSEEVYRTILEWIMEGELRPGEKLLDSELAERLGTSRTPVREALRRLEDKGLVETAANRWTKVTFVSIEEVERIYPIIWSLEALAVELAFPHLGREELALMAEANRDLSAALAAHEPVRASRADARLHQVVIDKSGNAQLADILASLKMKLRRLEVFHFEVYVVAAESVREHAEFMAALERGRDLESAQRLLRLNWQGSLPRLRQAMASRPESQPVGPDAPGWTAMQASRGVEVAG
jgi:DNA-binding GntR family transcriptional regulator